MNLSIFSEIGTTCKLKNPWAGTKLVVIETLGENSTIVSTYNYNDIYSFETKKGAVYTFNVATGIQQTEKSVNSFSIFPNPTRSFVNVLFNEKTTNEKKILNVSDIQGRILKSEILGRNADAIHIDFSNYSSGIYFISCNGETKKLMIDSYPK